MRQENSSVSSLVLTIDGRRVTASRGSSVLQAAATAGIYIPALCAHPALEGACRTESVEADDTLHLCLVAVEGRDGLLPACRLAAVDGMTVVTTSPEIERVRQERLARVLGTHPHVCLTCPQREGCSRTTCSFGQPVEARCCSIFNHCELRKVADHVGIPAQVAPYRHDALPIIRDEPFYDRDYNLCIDCRRCLVACNEVRGVGCLEIKNTNGRIWVGTIAPTLIESGCKFCNACVEVCPTGALLDRTLDPAQRATGLSPCTTACPAGIDVPRYVQLVGQGKYGEAVAVVREKLPFPGILGRVCFSPCETACRRGHLDDPLSIRSLKRVAADNDTGLWRPHAVRLPSTGRRAAVVGAGLAGLTVAWYLAKKGHAVTVFDEMPAAGGMARYGIPAYRLPRAVIDREVAEVADLGVEFRFNCRIDSVETLQQQGFEAIFLGIGASAARKLGISGDDLSGVTGSLDFLRSIALAQDGCVPFPDLTGKHVAVIGGGNVAADDGRSAWRLGAARVDLVYRRGEAEMPARAEEIQACRKEGIRLRFFESPKRIDLAADAVGRETDGRLAVTWGRMALGSADTSGRRRAVDIAGSEFCEEVDIVIVAVGQQVQGAERFGVQTENGRDGGASAGRILVREDSMLTSCPGVFAGGDAVLGPASLIEAVAQGRKAAAAMDAYLGGDGDIEETLLRDGWRTDPCIGPDASFSRQRRVLPISSDIGERKSWGEVEQKYASPGSKMEAARCLKCNLMADIGSAMLPPVAWRRLDVEALREVPDEAGVYRLFDADRCVLAIRGVDSLRAGLSEVLGLVVVPLFFDIELAHLYSQRESELLQAYAEQFGAMPPGIGEDSLDELY